MIAMILDENKIYFGRKNETVKLPSKIKEDAGYDIYANFEDEFVIIEPHETKMIPTGIHSAFADKWRVQLKERGSTGTKGIQQRSGVIDSGYRGEWLVPITNGTNKHIAIVKEEYVQELKEMFGDFITIYPYEKAICQAVLVEVPDLEVEELTVETILAIPSTRGEGRLGSSNK